VADDDRRDAAAGEDVGDVARGLALASAGPCAPTATTGRREVSIVRCVPSSTKSAPAAMAREAACITVSWLTSL
jgi:hypothetical protein